MSNLTDLDKTCYCILPHASQPGRFLVMRDNGWKLPVVQYRGDWFPNDVLKINQAIDREFGLRATVVRHLAQDRLRQERAHVCVLESHQAAWCPPRPYVWASSDDLNTLSVECPRFQEVLSQWWHEPQTTGPSVCSPWERPGWFAEAELWIHRQLRELRIDRNGPTEQLKGAWSGSTILRTSTSQGDIYFKADSRRLPGEPRIIRELSPQWRDSLPVVLANDLDKHWLLMKDFGGVPLSPHPIDRCLAAVQQYAQIQISTAARIPDWLRWGCGDLRAENLILYTRNLFHEAGDLSVDDDHLNTHEYRRLLQSLSGWEIGWRQLASLNVPWSIVQMDFRRDNVRDVDGKFLFFDWTQTVISHPFFSLNQFLDDFYEGAPPPGIEILDWNLDHAGDSDRRALRDAYLAPWTAWLPLTTLLQAFRLSRQLNPLFVAIRLAVERAYLDPASPYGQQNEAMLIACLKILLRQMEKSDLE